MHKASAKTADYVAGRRQAESGEPKKGFSRTQLSRALENAGIRYIHIEQLGNPSEIRAEYRKNGNAIQLYEDYKHYLEDHPEGIHILLEEMQNERACLFCFERYPCYCHRARLPSICRSVTKLRLNIYESEPLGNKTNSNRG